MVTAEEIVVSLKNEGARETQENLEGVDEQFDETTDSVGDSADELGGFASKWKGAMGAITAGLAVAASGILSRVPVIGESMVALESVIDSIALKLDQGLRPALNMANETLFETSRKIDESKGPLEALWNLLNGINRAITDFQVGILDQIAGFFGLDPPESVLRFFANLGRLNIPGIIGNLAGAIKNANLGEMLSGLGSGFANWATNNLIDPAIQWGKDIIGNIGSGIDEKISDLLAWGRSIPEKIASGIDGFKSKLVTAASNLAGEVTDRLGIDGIVGDALGWGEDLVKDIASGIGDFISNVKTKAGEIAGGVIDAIGPENGIVGDALDWGEDLVQGIIDGIQNKMEVLKEAADAVAGAISDRMPGSPAETGPLSDLDKSGPGLVNTLSSGMTDSVGQAQSAANDVASAADPEGFGANRDQKIQLFIDGREASRGTERFRDDSTSRRGRFS